MKTNPVVLIRVGEAPRVETRTSTETLVVRSEVGPSDSASPMLRLLAHRIRQNKRRRRLSMGPVPLPAHVSPGPVPAPGW